LLKRLGRNVVALGVVSLLTDLSSEMIYPLLPVFLSTTLGASATMLGVIEGIAESTAGVLKFASGWWSDKLGKRKPLVVAGYTLASIARPLVAVAQSANQVLLIRFTDRVGKGIRTAPRDALIADSVNEDSRGVAFGFHRAADHAGAVIGPLLAFVLLGAVGMDIRTVFLLASVPAALSVVVLVAAVREGGSRAERGSGGNVVGSAGGVADGGLGAPLWRLLAVIFLFTLGCSTDAFLLLRAADLGVPIALLPILWAMLHVVKSLSSTPGGALSDRRGRRPVLLAGWVLYAVVYLGFAYAQSEWHVWALFAVYGCYFGLVEGTEKALVADMVPAARRGAAFGAFNLNVSAAALPASLIFGLIWDRAGAATAFQFGAAIAIAACAALLLLTGSDKANA
jgi:MFS family permease